MRVEKRHLFTIAMEIGVAGRGGSLVIHHVLKVKVCIVFIPQNFLSWN